MKQAKIKKLLKMAIDDDNCIEARIRFTNNVEVNFDRQAYFNGGELPQNANFTFISRFENVPVKPRTNAHDLFSVAHDFFMLSCQYDTGMTEADDGFSLRQLREFFSYEDLVDLLVKGTENNILVIELTFH